VAGIIAETGELRRPVVRLSHGELSKLLDDVVAGKFQLPDFQRGWVWDDEHIRSLLVSVARSFPIGAVTRLETGGEAKFQTRACASWLPATAA
jgi:hypothetical protein